MSDITIEIKCGRCGGTGIDNNVEDENGAPVPESCTSCGGDGYIGSGKIDITDLQDKIDKILRRLKKIIDKLEINEEE